MAGGRACCCQQHVSHRRPRSRGSPPPGLHALAAVAESALAPTCLASAGGQPLLCAAVLPGAGDPLVRRSHCFHAACMPCLIPLAPLDIVRSASCLGPRQPQLSGSVDALKSRVLLHHSHPTGAASLRRLSCHHGQRWSLRGTKSTWTGQQGLPCCLPYWLMPACIAPGGPRVAQHGGASSACTLCTAGTDMLCAMR